MNEIEKAVAELKGAIEGALATFERSTNRAVTAVDLIQILSSAGGRPKEVSHRRLEITLGPVIGEW